MTGIGRLPSTLFSLINNYQPYIIIILSGLLLILTGIGISAYKGVLKESKYRIKRAKAGRFIECLEVITEIFPLKYVSKRLDKALGYLILDNITQRKLVAIFSILIPVAGFLIYCTIEAIMKLWYTKFVALALCFMVPYYTFTLALDYLRYSIKQRIPSFIDSFRSSFVSQNRIKPALQECCSNTNKHLARIMLRVSDSSDINDSLCAIRERINDTWFNIFVTLLINYRENGGELINQLYKLNKTITRYNNIEKKKNRRLIWYEFFTLGASIFSLPVIMLINRMILGANMRLYYNTAQAAGKIAIYSLSALIIVRVLRRL